MRAGGGVPGPPSIVGATLEREEQVVAVVEASSADELAAGHELVAFEPAEGVRRDADNLRGEPQAQTERQGRGQPVRRRSPSGARSFTLAACSRSWRRNRA